jgi:outer membrane receptor protein involved in Fe transport
MYGQLAKDKLPKNGVVLGKVIDAVTKQPIPYATIVVKDIDGKTITGGISEETGNFKISKIPEGKNIVEVQFIGYKTFSKEVNLTSDNLKHDMGTVALTEESANLDEVTVIAETSTITQKIDRKVINVGKDLTSAGTTASELLNNVPSVSVDQQTGNVSLRGNENVRVLIDGKPSNISSAQLLQQIPSTSIKSIELITNPSAKYNPEGMSGMINIILHKNANLGFNGTVNTGVTRGDNTRFNGSLDMNYKTGKVNFFTNYGLNTGKRHNFGSVIRRDNNSIQDFTFDNDNTSHLLKFGADVYINKKNTLSVYTTQNFFESIAAGGTVVVFENNATFNSNSPLNSITDSNSGAYNLNFKHDFDKEDHTIEFEANYSKTKAPEDAVYKQLLNLDDLTTNYIEDIENKRSTTLFNLDYTNPISKKGKLELGLELRLRKTKNDNVTTQHEFVFDTNGDLIDDGNGWFVTDPRGNSSFEYNRDIYSAYGTYSHKFGKLSMQVGARFEQYEVDGTFIKTKGNQLEKFTDEIFSIYPSTFFTYNPSEKNQYQVSYSRRVDRPSIQQVNPIREWSTPQITSVGNPDLKPQFTNSFELNYTRKLKKGSITFGTFYRRVNDNITRILNIDPLDDDKVELSYFNTDSNDRYGVELSANYRLAKWWRVNASADLYIQKEAGIANGSQLEVTNSSVNFRLSNSFTATKNLRFQLFTMYRGGGKSIQFDVDPMWMVNTGASLNVLKRKGTITFRVNDIFKTMKFAFDSENPYPQSGQFNWESNTAYLGFMYRFGSGKTKKRSRKNRKDNETQGGGFI